METYETKNKTDKGFIEFLYQFRSPVSTKRNQYLSNPELYRISPFDSKKKRMTTYIKDDSFPTGYRLFTKGASENVMMYSDKYLDSENGKVKEIDNDIKKYINRKIEKLNRKIYHENIG